MENTPDIMEVSDALLAAVDDERLRSAENLKSSSDQPGFDDAGGADLLGWIPMSDADTPVYRLRTPRALSRSSFNWASLLRSSTICSLRGRHGYQIVSQAARARH